MAPHIQSPALANDRRHIKTASLCQPSPSLPTTPQAHKTIIYLVSFHQVLQMMHQSIAFILQSHHRGHRIEPPSSNARPPHKKPTRRKRVADRIPVHLCGIPGKSRTNPHQLHPRTDNDNFMPLWILRKGGSITSGVRARPDRIRLCGQTGLSDVLSPTRHTAFLIIHNTKRHNRSHHALTKRTLHMHILQRAVLDAMRCPT